MPDFQAIQTLMDSYFLSYDQAVRLYWLMVEGYNLLQALKMV